MRAALALLALLIAASTARADEIKDAIAAAKDGIAKGDTTEAVARLRPLVEKYPDDVRPHWWLAHILEKEGKYREAAELMAEFVERVPDDPHGKSMLRGIAETALDTGDPRITRWCMKFLRRVEPNEKDYLYLTALASYRLGELDSVRQACRELIRRWGSYADAYLLLARALEEDGRGTEAGQVYRDLVKERPGDVEARIYLAYWLLRDARDFDRAAEEFTSALMQSEPGSSQHIRAQTGLDRTTEERDLIERLHAHRGRLVTIAIAVAAILVVLVSVGAFLTRPRSA
jgi:predicted Zn-dependent protease